MARDLIWVDECEHMESGWYCDQCPDSSPCGPGCDAHDTHWVTRQSLEAYLAEVRAPAVVGGSKETDGQH